MATGLATRCPACGTVFRVVPDQLRVSEGWVRCGRCTEVFNATQSLVDLDAAAPRSGLTAVPPPAAPQGPAQVPPSPAPLPPTPTASTAPGPAAARGVGTEPAPPPDAADSQWGALDEVDISTDDLSAFEPLREDPADEWLPTDVLAVYADSERGPASVPAPWTVPGAAEAGEAAGVVDTADWAQAAQAAQSPGAAAAAPVSAQTRSAEDAAGAPRSSQVSAITWSTESAAPAPASAGARRRSRPTARPSTQAARPGFLRRAERAERWRRPWVRALLGLVLVLGLGGLAGQVLHEYRDLAAARYPQLRPLLEQGCAFLDCRVGAARAIDSLAVESSGLVRVDSSDLYRLSVVLRNRSGIDLALPALELALTDRQGRLIARKVLRAGELGVAGEALAAGAEATLAGTLRVGEGPVTGYAVELFYP